MSMKRASYLCCNNLASSSYGNSPSSTTPIGQERPLQRHIAPQSRSFSSTIKKSMPRSLDHYKSLKLPNNATKQQIKAKFYELSKKTHPDAPGGSADKFHEINEAYEILGDESKRRQYDLSLSGSSSSSRPGYQNYHNPSSYSSSSYPYSDPLNRRSGPHAGWSTRRPPPQAPPTGFGTYSPFGRHTPPKYSGASSGSYGDPFEAAREQFRQSFQNIKAGKRGAGWPDPFGSMNGHHGAGAGGMKPKLHGGQSRQTSNGDMGRIIGTFALVILVIAFGGTVSTARAEQSDDEREENESREREQVISSLGIEGEVDDV